MSGIIERIVDIIDYKGINKRTFYKDTGLSNGFLDKVKSIGSDKIESILSSYPDINPLWIITGEGSMIRESSAVTSNNFKLGSDNSLGEQNIPLYSIEASAGLVELFRNQGDNEAIDTLRIPNLPKCDGAIFITGDSMYPLLKSGDIVAYKQVHDMEYGIFWGEMYLLSIDVDGEEYVSVKYVQKSERGDSFIKLVSQNQHHQPKDIPLKNVRAIALIKASVRINSMG